MGELQEFGDYEMECPAFTDVPEIGCTCSRESLRG